MQNFIQGEQITLYINFLDSKSSPILSGISDVSLDIYHFSSSIKIYDVSGTSMIQDSDNLNIFYFNYQIDTESEIIVLDSIMSTGQLAVITFNQVKLFPFFLPLQ